MTSDELVRRGAGMAQYLRESDLGPDSSLELVFVFASAASAEGAEGAEGGQGEPYTFKSLLKEDPAQRVEMTATVEDLGVPAESRASVMQQMQASARWAHRNAIAFIVRDTLQRIAAQFPSVPVVGDFGAGRLVELVDVGLEIDGQAVPAPLPVRSAEPQ